MDRVDLTKVPDFLRQQRWFAGKAQPIESVSLVDYLELPTTDAGKIPILAIVEVTYAMGSKERYLMPVETGPQGELQEALNDPKAASVLLEYVRAGRTVQSGTGVLKAHAVLPDSPLLAAVTPDIQPKILAAEQSNTSVVFGDKVLLKVLRKLEPGASLEVEVGRFLATRTQFRNTPLLLGTIELEGTFSTTLAVVHQFIPHSQDGWQWCLEQMRKGDAGKAELLREAERIGKLIGDLHVALASDAEDPGFAPSTVLQEDLQRWSSSLIGELGVTLTKAGALFPDAVEMREPLLGRAQRLSELTNAGAQIRIHGDLHLGQALRNSSGWWVYDFEGEPARPIAQRREKHSPLRDVAGMMRSFDYGAAVAEVAEDQRPALVSAAQDAFLKGYRTATQGKAFVPQDDASFHALLEILVLEKALYEVRYELQSRPDWAKIPLRYLRSLAGGQS